MTYAPSRRPNYRLARRGSSADRRRLTKTGQIRLAIAAAASEVTIPVR
jgi:hypothetical protein